MKKRLLLCLTTMLLIAGGTLSADQTFTDPDAFEAAVGANADVCLGFDFSGFEEGQNDVPLENVQPFGTLSFGDSGFGQGTGFNFAQSITGVDTTGAPVTDSAFIVPAQLNATITLDPNNGLLSGFILPNTATVDLTFTIFDTEGNVVDTVVAPALPDLADVQFTGWANCDNIEIGRIEIVTVENTLLFGLFSNDTNFCFIEPPVEEEPTAQDCIEDVIASINDVFASASPQDQAFLTQAIYELEGSLDPTFWATEDRLSSYGTGFFDGVFVATYFLECVEEDALVEDILISIQDCLSLIVQNEIDFALENPYVDNNLLAYSDFFESYADAYSEAGFYLEAVLLHFYAWLFAFWA